MNYLSLEEVRNLVITLANKINTPIYCLPTFGVNEDFARPEIRVKKNGYHYVIMEKGQEIEYQVTQNIDELLYWTFKDITFEMACDHEVRNRMQGYDFRRLLFDKQIEFINLINEEFSKLLKSEIEVILKKSPFKD